MFDNEISIQANVIDKGFVAVESEAGLYFINKNVDYGLQ